MLRIIEKILLIGFVGCVLSLIILGGLDVAHLTSHDFVIQAIPRLVTIIACLFPFIVAAAIYNTNSKNK